MAVFSLSSYAKTLTNEDFLLTEIYILEKLGLYTLSGADLRGAKLQGANLGGVKLISANLERADLRGAKLQGADLSRADLRDAHLERADLRGADLRGVRGNLYLAEAFYNKYTVFSYGFDPDEHYMIFREGFFP